MANLIHLGVILLFYVTGAQCGLCSPDDCFQRYGSYVIVALIVACVVSISFFVYVICANCCCYRQSKGHVGQVYKPSYSEGAPYNWPTTNPIYDQTAYVIGAYSEAQIQTAFVQPGTAQRLEAPPTIKERTIL